MVKVETSHIDEIPEIVEFHINWGDLSRAPLLNFPEETMRKLTHRLLGSPYIGGKVPHSTVCGYILY